MDAFPPSPPPEPAAEERGWGPPCGGREGDGGTGSLRCVSGAQTLR